MFSKFAARRRGFTLIELLIVIVVIAILALIVIPKLMGASRRAKDSSIRGNLQILRSAVEKFHADTGCYPTGLDQLIVAPTGTPTVATGTLQPGTYKGPYLTGDGGIVGKAGIPKNPYAQDSTTISEHWSYTVNAATDLYTVKPGTSTTGNDADGKPYSDY